MKTITLLAHAKLNLSLDISGLREDGYHQMDMVMQSVSLSDRVSVQREERLTPESFPFGEKDIAFKAARAFFRETGLRGGAEVTVEKKIPDQAGMAGGSADAAAVLIALDRLYKTGLNREELIRLGVTAGADVPFCLVGGTARVSGIGEIVCPLPFFGKGNYLIVKPPFGVSTPAAFSAFDRMGEKAGRPDNEALISALQEGRFEGIGRLTGNVLETAAGIPEIREIRAALIRAGARFSLMTGSGSAVFGWFETKEKADSARKALLPYGKVFVADPEPEGVSILSEK